MRKGFLLGLGTLLLPCLLAQGQDPIVAPSPGPAPTVAQAGSGDSNPGRVSAPASAALPAPAPVMGQNGPVPALVWGPGDPGLGVPSCTYWASAEYLLWCTRGSPLPPLLTTSTGTAGLLSGALGQPGTSVLVGSDRPDSGLRSDESNQAATAVRSGARLMVGCWTSPDRQLGLEVGGFFLQSLTSTYSFSYPGVSALYRPVFDPVTNKEDVQILAGSNVPGQFTGTLTGSFQARLDSSFWGAEANARWCLSSGNECFLDGLIGLRTLALHENLDIRVSSQAVTTVTESAVSPPPGSPVPDPFLPPPPLPILAVAGIAFRVDDNFKANNQFYGGQIGAVTGLRVDDWIFNVTGKLGLGDTLQTVSIAGSTLTSVPGTPSQVVPSGFLAGVTNMGHYSRQVFGVVPEVGVNIGYQVTGHVQPFLGYNFLYWSSVVRPGNQIDGTLNPTFVPGSPVSPTGPPHPTFVFNGSGFWAQGLTLGVAVQW